MSKPIFINKSLQLLVLIYLLSFGVIVLHNNHGEVVLWTNERHSIFLDQFFKYLTHLGDGLVLGVFAFALLLTNYYKFFQALIAIATQTALVLIFKLWLAEGEPRPKVFFADRINELNFIEGVEVRNYGSFPSGHTASAFTLAFILILLVKNETWRIVIFIAALLIGFSRVYLIQHFMIDVYIGSVFGIISVLVAWKIMLPYQDRVKLQRGLLKK
jgi:membrane-associated phospholipid phosphatase